MWKSGGDQVLFVGGPYDGKRVAFSSEDRIVRVYGIKPLTMERHEVVYYIHRLRDSGGEYRVALVQGEDNPIGQLVKRYPRFRRKR